MSSYDGKVEYIGIEHENDPFENKIHKSISNLSASEATYKVLITYTLKNLKPEDLISRLQKYKQNYKLENLYLIYGSYGMDSADQFKLESI